MIAPNKTNPEEQQLDQATRERILQADLANIVKKVKSGRPLSQSERDLIESSAERATDDDDDDKLRLPSVVKKHPGGRPIKFTTSCLKRILRCAGRGMPLSLCAAAVGVSPMGMTLHRRKHPKFEAALQAAIAQGADRRLRKIEEASEKGTWAASAWMLEHCLPQHFSRNRVELTGADGSPLVGVVAIMLPPKQDSNGNGSPVVTVPALTERSADGNGD